MFKSMLKKTLSDVGSDGEFDQKFKLNVIKTADNHKLRNDLVQFPPHAIQQPQGKLEMNSSPGADLIHKLINLNQGFAFWKKFTSGRCKPM